MDGFVRLLRACLLLVSIMLATTSCSISVDRDETEAVDLTTNTSSAEFATAAERIEFAGRYVDFAGPVDDVYFDIVYFDNADGRAPGPSDWDMEFVFVIDPSTVDAWTLEHSEVDELNIVWANRLLDGAIANGAIERGEFISPPRHFERFGSRVSVYADDGIVLRRVATLF